MRGEINRKRQQRKIKLKIKDILNSNVETPVENVDKWIKNQNSEYSYVN